MSLSKEALHKTLSIYQAITVSPQFRNICAITPQHQCISHSVLSLWDYNQQNVENDSNIIKTINNNLHRKSTRTGISLYPFSNLGNVKIDHNTKLLVSADSFILTFILKNTKNALTTWNQILLNSIASSDLFVPNVKPCKFQFKLKLLPNITKSTYMHIIVFLFMNLLMVILFKNQFSRSRMIKSRTGLGLASVFLSFACFTMTSRLFQWSQKDIQIYPWFLKLFICITTTVEHIFFITSAVMEREKKEITIKEKVGKGLEQTAIPMLAALILKVFVLLVGSRTYQQNIKDFCLFALVAISISFLLSLTVFTAILSIDIRRAELSDLNNDISKSTKKESIAYPRLDKDPNKKRNARRAVNTLILCIILLYLNLFSPRNSFTKDNLIGPNTDIKEWKLISDQFWNIMNPFYDTQSFDIYPPTIITTEISISPLESYYQEKFSALHQVLLERTNQYTFLDKLHPYFLFTPHRISNGILLIILVLIILWMIPTTREKIMLSTFRKVFVVVVTFILRAVSKVTFIKTDKLIRKVESDYNEEGMHVGALSLQSEFNRNQNLERVGHVDVKTFCGQHLSDIRTLKGQQDILVSLDQEGKIVVWNTHTQQPSVCLGRQARCLQMNKDAIAAGFDDGHICVWDRHFMLVYELKTSHPVSHILLLDKVLISVHRNGDLCEWKDGQLIQTTSTKAHIICIHCSEPYLFTSSKDAKVVCWDIKTWKQQYTLANDTLVTSLATQVLRDGVGILVTGSMDGAVKVWDLNTGSTMCTLSKGGIVKKESDAEEVGGPLLQFSTVARHYQPKTEPVNANHDDAISQVVTTRISNPDFDEDTCPACRKVLTSGFFIASCGMNGSVHVWRLDRLSGYTGCVQCAKDYHPRKHRSDEQWQPLFLGKLTQEGGRCLVLFDTMILAGLRQMQGRWEVWFTSLQYFEPSVLADDWTIPSVVRDLERDDDIIDEESDNDYESNIFEFLLFFTFGMKKAVKPVKKTKSKNNEREMAEYDDLYELLPFSSVRYAWKVNETSFCCDYGNFLKLVSFHPEQEEK